MKASKYILLLLAIVLSSCGVPKYATISGNPNLSKYRYVYITPTSGKTSVSGGVLGATSSSSVGPAEIISGRFIKQGFIRLPEIDESKKSQTIIVNYGESDKKYHGLLYSIEATIQILDASSYEVLCTFTAEGMGDTEADDIRKAIDKCLDAIFLWAAR